MNKIKIYLEINQVQNLGFQKTKNPNKHKKNIILFLNINFQSSFQNFFKSPI